MKRILVIQLRELGDTLLTTPLIRQLGRLHQDAELDVVCERRSQPIFAHHPAINQCFLLERRSSTAEFVRLAWQLARRRYDMVVDAQSLSKTALLARLCGAPLRLGFRRRGLCSRLCYTHPFGFYQRHFGNFLCPGTDGGWLAEYAALTKLKLLQDPRVNLSDVALDFYIGPDERRQALAFRRRFFRPPVAAVYGTSRRGVRRWRSDRLAEVADRLMGRGYQVFLVHGPGEQPLAREIAHHLRGEALIDYPQVSLGTFKGIMEGCALFVGVDGGPKHVAVASGIPTVALFGRTHPDVWTAPVPDQRYVASRADRRAVPASRPCTQAEDLADIPVDAVWVEVEEVLAGNQRQAG